MANETEEQVDLRQSNIVRLIRQLRSRPGIVPFVGAGVSVPYGMPGWRDFLIAVGSEYGLKVEIEECVQKGDFEGAAEILLEQLGTLAFDDIVEDWFGDDRIQAPGVESVADLLPNLAHGPILTTNFDRVLESVFRNAGVPFDQYLRGSDIEAISAALQQDQRILIKLHGDIYDRKNRILTKSEYQSHYGETLEDSVIRPIPSVLERMLSARTVVFIGCSLRTDRTMGAINKASDQLGAFIHYAILSRPSIEEQYRARINELSNLQIRPIWYPEGQHGAVLSILTHVLQESQRQNLPRQPQLLVTAPEFFEPFMNKSNRLLRHDWDLVGREDVLVGLQQWIDNDDYPIAVMLGRGGAGKSKVLHALSERFPESNGPVCVRFVLPNIRFSAIAAVLPPAKLTIIVVDDAHQRDDLDELLLFIRSNPQNTKLLLTSRPYQTSFIQAKLGEASFDVRQFVTLSLPDLTTDDIRALARQALEPDFDRYVERLVEVTRDSPLATLVGGELLAQRLVSPDLLEQDEEFRTSVFDRFGEIIEGRIADLVDPLLQRNLLALLAAVGPIKSNDRDFLKRAGDFLDVAPQQVAEALDSFEYAGALMRRGRIVRITPDILADHILFRACVRLDGSSTGYAERAFDAFRDHNAESILMSLSELDWRLRVSRDSGSQLLQEIWQLLEQELHSASHRERFQLLRMLANTGTHQPDRMLSFVDFIMRNPTAPIKPKHVGLDRDVHEGVLEAVAPILFRIGHNIDYLPRTCDLLWELGRDDDRPLNQNPDHPIRLLQEIANYDYEKTLAVNDVALERISLWLNDELAFGHTYTPLDVLDSLFAKTGSSQHVEGHMLVLSPFSVNVDATRELRSRAIELLKQAVTRNLLPIDLRVLQSLSKVIEAPRYFSGAYMPPEESAAWLSERILGFDLLKALVTQRQERTIYLKAAQMLTWYTTYEAEPTIRKAVVDIIESIPVDLELRLLFSLAHDFSLWRARDGSFDPKDWDTRKALARSVLDECVTELVTYNTNPSDGAKTIENSLLSLRIAVVNHAPYEFLGVLGTANPEYLIGIASYAIAQRPPELSRYLGSMLARIRLFEPNRAISLAQRVLEENDPVLLFALASWPSICRTDAQATDFEIISQLLVHENTDLRGYVLDSMVQLGKRHPREVSEIALTVELGRGSFAAEAFCELFDAENGINPDILERDDISSILQKLTSVDSIDGHWTKRFLTYVLGRSPSEIIQMLISRIRMDRSERGPEFRPIPYDGLSEVFEGFSDQDFYIEGLTQVRDLALENDHSLDFWLPRLFATVVDEFAEGAETLVREWVSSNDAIQVHGAALLMSSMPPSFIFENVPLIVDLIESASRLGNSVYRNVGFLLRNSNFSQMRSRTVGVQLVTPQDEELKRRAELAMENLLVGSPGYGFFADLKAIAEDNMLLDQLRDEEEFD